jgi:DNA helicase-2/ATP-dependent DNA helicase PcrA
MTWSPAEYVAQQVLQRREAGTALRRQAVLFRTSSHSDLLEVELARRKIPFVKYGGLKFLEAAHVKDLISVLRWADNPRNTLAAFRALQLLPGMGPVNARWTLDALAEAGGSIKAMRGIKVNSQSERDYGRLAELMEKLGEPGKHGRPAAPGARGTSRTWSASSSISTRASATWTSSSSSRSSFRRANASSPSSRSTRRMRPAIFPARRTRMKTTWCSPPSTRPRAWSGTPSTC